ASMDSRTAAEGAAPGDRARVFHGWRLLPDARLGAGVVARRHCRTVRALWRLHSLGFQHGPAPAGSSRPVQRANLRRRARAGYARLVGVKLLDGVRARSRRMVSPNDGVRSGDTVLRPRDTLVDHRITLEGAGHRRGAGGDWTRRGRGPRGSHPLITP